MDKFLEASWLAYEHKLDWEEFWSIVISNDEIGLDMIKLIKGVKR